MIDLNDIQDSKARQGACRPEQVKIQLMAEQFNREVDAHIKRAERSAKVQRAAHRLMGYTTERAMWDEWSTLHLDGGNASEGPTLGHGSQAPPEPPPVRMGRCAALDAAGWRWRGRIEGSGTAEGV